MIPFLLRLSPTARWIIAGVAALVCLGALILWLGAREKADDTANQQIGATVEREAVQRETINQGVKANAAAQEVRTDPVARDAECVRHARNPKDC